MRNIFYLEDLKNKNKKNTLVHWQECIEIIHVVEGSVNCMVQGDLHELKKGDLCIINAKNIHRIYSDKKNGKCERLLMEPELFSPKKEITEDFLGQMISDSDFDYIITSEDKQTSAKEIINLMKSVGEFEVLKPIAYELAVVGLVHMIFQRLYYIYKNVETSPSEFINPDILIYRKIADQIYKSFAKDLTLDDIANFGSVSRSKCCNIFKKYAKNTPINFLNLYRLKRSAVALERSSESVMSIAMSCGFGQASYFNRLFLREYGMTPTQYRKLKKKK